MVLLAVADGLAVGTPISVGVITEALGTGVEVSVGVAVSHPGAVGSSVHETGVSDEATTGVAVGLGDALVPDLLKTKNSPPPTANNTITATAMMISGNFDLVGTGGKLPMPAFGSSGAPPSMPGCSSADASGAYVAV